MKGFLGTVLILFVFPILCISVSLTSLFFAITAPITVPVAAVVLHIYMMLVYDLDSPDEDRNKYCIFLEAIGWNILIQGILQPILALCVAAFICPLASVAVLMGEFRNLLKSQDPRPNNFLFSWFLEILVEDILGFRCFPHLHQEMRSSPS